MMTTEEPRPKSKTQLQQQNNSLVTEFLSAFQIELLTVFSKVSGLSDSETEENMVKTVYAFADRLNAVRSLITAERVKQCVCDVMHCNPDEFKKRIPTKHYKYIKLIYFKLCENYCLQTQDIKASTAYTTRSNYIQCVSKAEGYYQVDRAFQILYHLCEDQLLGRIQPSAIPTPSI